MATAPNLPLQDGSAAGGGSLAVRRANSGAVARGVQPHTIPMEDDTTAASTPTGRAAGSASSTGAMGRTRSREERERRRRASMPAIADRLAEATLALPRQGPTTVNTYAAYSRGGPGPAGQHENILIDILRGELHAAMQLMDHREAWWMQGMRNAESAVGQNSAAFGTTRSRPRSTCTRK